MFDDKNLVSSAGLVPVLELAEQAGLSELLDTHVVFTDERVRSGAANPVPKLSSIIGGMLAGADSIDDLDVVRSGGMKRLFGGVYASATLGIFLREFTFGHVRQLGAVLGRHLLALADWTDVLAGVQDLAFVDIDSLLRPVYGHAKQGASFGHTKIGSRQVLRLGLSPRWSRPFPPPCRTGGRRPAAPRRPGRFGPGRREDDHRGHQHRKGCGCEKHSVPRGFRLRHQRSHRRCGQGECQVLVRAHQAAVGEPGH